MIKIVTLIRGVGNYSKKWGYSAHERLVISHATVTHVNESDPYYQITGKAVVYKGKKSKTIVGEEEINQRVKKSSSWLTIEDLSIAVDYILEN